MPSASERAVDIHTVMLEMERINGFVQQNRDVLGRIIHTGLERKVFERGRHAGGDGV